jgi:hypothetical protein
VVAEALPSVRGDALQGRRVARRPGERQLLADLELLLQELGVVARARLGHGIAAEELQEMHGARARLTERAVGVVQAGRPLERDPPLLRRRPRVAVRVEEARALAEPALEVLRVDLVAAREAERREEVGARRLRLERAARGAGEVLRRDGRLAFPAGGHGGEGSVLRW